MLRKYLRLYGYNPLSVNDSSTLRFISRLVLAVCMTLSKRSKNSSSSLLKYPILGMFNVTTPIEPVSGLAPKKPPPRFRNSRLSIRRRQHMLRTSSGFMSLFTKFEKYGTPYLAVTSKSAFDTGESHLKSLVMLYVGMGKVKTLPLASPCFMTSA